MGQILTVGDVERARSIARALLLKAVDREKGRDEADAFYQVVTERRDLGAARHGYSSCGDLAHWLLRCLGVRAAWLNRDDDDDGRPWKSGVNLNFLVPPPIGRCALAKPKLQTDPEPGDVLVQTNQFGGHVLCVLELVGSDHLITAEYGQPGGKRKVHEGFRSSLVPKLISHLRLADVLAACVEAPDFRPLQDWLTGEELDALGDDTPGPR